MNKVYLIDDSNAQAPNSKFQQFTAFVQHLNTTFFPHTFEWGLLTSVNGVQQHNDLLSGNSDDIIAILSDPDALILVDVLMPITECVNAGKAILNSFPHCSDRALEIGRILTATLHLTQIPDDYLLCAAIIAFGETQCARVAVVSTETQNPARGAVGVLGPKEIGWNAAAWTLPPNTENIKAWVLQDILEDVKEWRAEWNRLQEETKAPRWSLRNPQGALIANQKLFLSGLQGTHELTDGLGRFTHSGIDRANASMLGSATAWFEKNVVSLNSDAERLAVLKAASRSSQIPVFVAQRILGVTEIGNVTLAMSATPPAWDAPSILLGLKKLAIDVPKPTFDLQNGSGRWELTVSITGSAQQLDKAEAALKQGAVRRYRGRGSTGELTLGIELLSPTVPIRSAGSIVVKRSFNQEQL